MLAYEGVKSLGEEGDFEVTYLENVLQEDIPATAEKSAQEGYDLIIGHGFQFVASFMEIAPEYPDSLFFVSSLAPPGEVIPQNLQFVDLQWHYGGYLAGALAALVSDSHVVGIVGGADNPVQRSIANAFIQGAEETVPGTKGLAVITGDYNDAAKGREAALNLIDEGADVIMHWANITGLGAIVAAVELDKIVIGVYSDQTSMAWDHFASSMTVDLAYMIITKAHEVRDGTFQGGGVWAPSFDRVFKFKAGTGQFNSDIVSDRISTRIDEITQRILDGDILVRIVYD
jgi:basic membrane protein A